MIIGHQFKVDMTGTIPLLMGSNKYTQHKQHQRKYENIDIISYMTVLEQFIYPKSDNKR